MLTLLANQDKETKNSLIDLSSGAGCGCKIAPEILHEILSDLNFDNKEKKLLVGNETKDDAAVYDLETGMALISTTDFFMPIVNDPFSFGKIAATNALSDVYAMGGKPFLALAIMGLPIEKVTPNIAKEILRGAQEVCKNAGVNLGGGHTIQNPEPFFGLSVNGFVKKENLKRNNTAQEGDLIFMTKKIGTGVLTTAFKRKLISEMDLQEAIESMCTLNHFGEQISQLKSVNALTDITGFGLLGHLLEMCDGADLSAEIKVEKIPLMEQVAALNKRFIYADNTMRNWKSYEAKTAGISGDSLLILCDPQTSGGLMISVNENSETDFLEFAKQQNVVVNKIGFFRKKSEKSVYVN